MNGYNLSRNWFDFCFENPEKINPNHSAIYFFAIEHCNRLGWKEKFGFPTQMVMDAVGIKKYQTYIKYFEDLCEWGFFKLLQKSKNQYSANIICLQFAMPKNGKALDKAIINHAAKQTETTGQSTGQSNSSIDKPNNHKPDNHKPQTTKETFFSDFPNSSYLESVCRDLGKSKDEILSRLSDFRAVSEADYNSMSDFSTHLKRWINKHPQRKTGGMVY